MLQFNLWFIRRADKQLQLHFLETVPQVRLLPDLWGPLIWESGEHGVSIYSIFGFFSKDMQNVMAALS